MTQFSFTSGISSHKFPSDGKLQHITIFKFLHNHSLALEIEVDIEVVSRAHRVWRRHHCTELSLKLSPFKISARDLRRLIRASTLCYSFSLKQILAGRSLCRFRAERRKVAHGFSSRFARQKNLLSSLAREVSGERTVSSAMGYTKRNGRFDVPCRR